MFLNNIKFYTTLSKIERNMTIADELGTAVEQFTDQLTQQYSASLFSAPDLPPLNISISNMNAVQKDALAYWRKYDNLKYVYMQMMDSQGKTYNASYLDENEELKPDMYVSAFESTSGMCNKIQQEQIQNWIELHLQFEGVRLENMDDYGVEITQHLVSTGNSNSVTILTIIVSIIAMFFSVWVGCILLILGAIFAFYSYQQDKKIKKTLDLKMWRDTLTSRIESYLEHKIQIAMQKEYDLVDETEQQMEDDNVKEYELSDELKQVLSTIETNILFETEDEKGTTVYKSMSRLKQEKEMKKEDPSNP